MTIDPVSPLLSGIASNKPQTYALAFAAGAVSSLGPCALPRCLAAAGMAQDSLRTSAARFVLLQAGLTAGYCCLGLGSSFVAALVRHSSLFYLVLAGFLCISGIRALVGNAPRCEHTGTRSLSAGGIFLMGASFAFIVSPCCTPIVLAVGTLSASPVYAAGIMAAFAAGHGITMLAALAGIQTMKRRLFGGSLISAAPAFSGTLLLALGAYYAVLA